MVKISVLILAHNNDRYIIQAIESVLKQKYSNYQIVIAIDEKNVDSKIQEKIEEYKKSRLNIEICYHCLKRVSEVRNSIMYNQQVTGEYLLFLDGDDYLANENVLGKINNYIKKNMSDIYIFDFFSEGLVRKKRNLNGGKSVYFPKYDKGDKISQILNNRLRLPNTVWQCVFKNQFIKNSELVFNEKYYYGEDYDFVIRCLIKAENIEYVNEPIINYRLYNTTSLTNITSYNVVRSYILVSEDMYNMYSEAGRYSNYFIELLANKYCNSIIKVFKIDSQNERYKIYKEVNIEILKKAKSAKYTIIKCVWKVFGYEFGNKILSFLYYRIKNLYFNNKF